VLSGNLGFSMADSYLFQMRFMQLHGPFPESFQPVSYLEAVAGHTLSQMVAFSPLTWLPMIPVLAFFEQVKISDEVIGDDTTGKTAGLYIESPFVLWSSVALEMIGVLWAIYNYTKLYHLKTLLRPRTALDKKGKLTYTMPQMYDDSCVAQWLDSPIASITDWLALLTGLRGSADEHVHHSLFCAAGHRGPELLLRSLKLHTWLLVMGAFFTVTQVNAIDIRALLLHGRNGVIEFELAFMGAMALSFLVLLFWVTPATFSLYNVVVSTEGMADKRAIAKATGGGGAAHGHH